MIINITIATLVYFTIGCLIFSIIEPSRGVNYNVSLFTFTFIVSLLFCLIYYNIWLILGLSAHKGVEGLFSPDSSTYYLEAKFIARSNYSGQALERVITDHYHQLFIAAQLYVFGEHVLIPKIYQVFLSSISVVLWVTIARDILRDSKLVNYFYYLLLFCVPILTFNAHVLKEISLYFATTLAIYGYTKYSYATVKNIRFIFVALTGIILMFFFRRQFALIILFSFIIGTLFGAELSLNKKGLWSAISLIAFFVISTTPIFQQIEATAPLTERGVVFIGRAETGRRISSYSEGGMIGSATYLLQHPITVAPMFAYGSLMVFFHPSFLYSPTEMISRANSRRIGLGGLDYLTMGYYNLFFTFLLPAFFFGAWYLYKYRRGDPVIISLIVYFILTNIMLIFGCDSYRRFKLSYFWPISYLVICFGIGTYFSWKKYLPFVAIVFGLLLITYLSADIIGLVTL